MNDANNPPSSVNMQMQLCNVHSASAVAKGEAMKFIQNVLDRVEAIIVFAVTHESAHCISP